MEADQAGGDSDSPRRRSLMGRADRKRGAEAAGATGGGLDGRMAEMMTPMGPRMRPRKKPRHPDCLRAAMMAERMAQGRRTRAMVPRNTPMLVDMLSMAVLRRRASVWMPKARMIKVKKSEK